MEEIKMDKPIRKAVRCYLIKDNLKQKLKLLIIEKSLNKETKKDIMTYLVVKLKKENYQSKQL